MFVMDQRSLTPSVQLASEIRELICMHLINTSAETLLFGSFGVLVKYTLRVVSSFWEKDSSSAGGSVVCQISLVHRLSATLLGFGLLVE